jgi:hypothetical protein
VIHSRVEGGARRGKHCGASQLVAVSLVASGGYACVFGLDRQRLLCCLQSQGASVGRGSEHDRPSAGFTAVDQSLQVGRLEAAGRQQVQPTHQRHLRPRIRRPEAAAQTKATRPKVVPRRRAHIGLRPSARLRRGARLETVHAHGSRALRVSHRPAAPVGSGWRSATVRTSPPRPDHSIPARAAACGQLHLHTEASSGTELPRFVEHEVGAYLDCGTPGPRLLSVPHNASRPRPP